MTELSRMLLVLERELVPLSSTASSKEGLAKRMPSETDRRTIYVALTPVGGIAVRDDGGGVTKPKSTVSLQTWIRRSRSTRCNPFRAIDKTPAMGAAA